MTSDKMLRVRSDSEPGAGGGGDLHCLRLPHQPHARPHLLLVGGGGQQALKHVRVLVRDVEHPRAALEDLRQLGRVHQPFDRAVGDEGGGRERADRRRQALQRHGRARGTDRDRRGLPGRGDDHVEGLRAEPVQGELRELDVERPGLALREHRAGVAAADLAELENLGEEVDPLSLDGAREHAAL